MRPTVLKGEELELDYLTKNLSMSCSARNVWPLHHVWSSAFVLIRHPFLRRMPFRVGIAAGLPENFLQVQIDEPGSCTINQKGLSIGIVHGKLPPFFIAVDVKGPTGRLELKH
jgi:hypothetical protein